MANNAENIKNSWSFMAFARMKGRPQLGTFVKEDQDGNKQSFKSVVFTDESNPDSKTNKVFVAFSRNLGELTAKQISDRKHDLQVVECLTAEGNTMYSLCNKGENSWEDIAI